MRVYHAVFCGGRTHWVVVSAAAAQNRMRDRYCGPKRCLLHAPTAVGGTADGTDQSTGDTENMAESAGTGETLA